MSYRDLRNLCEILRAVGYPRLVSIENFRNPNFALVADISRWLVLQYEPKADIPSSCDTEGDRVALVRTFAEFMLINVQVKLNTKRLYQADGYAVKELIKVASVLYNAVREAEFSHTGGTTYSSRIPLESDLVRIDTKELKETRQLASTLVQKGVNLYDMLSKEVNLREARQQALSKAYEHAEVERLIRSAIETGGQEAKKMTGIIETVQNNLATLDGKADKKKMELDRSQKRLLTLKKVRPAFMDEFEELQQEMSVIYQEYVNRFRCLSFIQHQIDDMDRLDEERKVEQRLSKAEFGRRSGDDLLSYGKGGLNSSGSDEEEDDSSDEMSLGLNKTAVPPSTTGNSSRSGGHNDFGYPAAVVGGKFINDNGITNGGGDFHNGTTTATNNKSGRQRKMYGSMNPSDSESDMILVDGDNDNSELGSEDDEDELAVMHKEHLGGGGGGGASSKMGRSGAHIRTDIKQNFNDVNKDGNHITNGGGGGRATSTANGGKGYPIDNNNTVQRNQQQRRPTTGGRKIPVSDDDDF